MQPASPRFHPGNADSAASREEKTAPTLIVIRGNSGSGKTTTAREVRRWFGRGCALLEQDHLRRTVLREHDSRHFEPVAPRFIAGTARQALDLGYHVVLEGIMHSARYREALTQLVAEHDGPSHVFYFDVPLEVTIRRNRKRIAGEGFDADDMRSWYAERDVLGVPGEVVLGEVDPAQAVDLILHDSGLAEAAALTPCPARCPRCREKEA